MQIEFLFVLPQGDIGPFEDVAPEFDPIQDGRGSRWR